MRYDLPLHLVLFITNWLPDNVIFIRLRGRLARPFFKSCGRRLGIGRNVCIYNSSFMSLGEDVYIAYGCWFNCTGGVEIHDEVLFGPYCIIASSNHSLKNGSYRFGNSILKKIIVGKGSWISSHVTITAGTVIGESVLVAANSVVNKTIEDRSVVGGIPARNIRN